MKTYSLILFCCLLSISVFAQQSSISQKQKDNLALIERRIVADLRSTTNQVAAKNIDTKVGKLQSEKLRADGSFKNIDYDTKVLIKWNAVEHLANIESFIIAYTNPLCKKYDDKILYDNIIASLDYWNKKDPISPNWYSNEIACPRVIGQILLLLQNANISIPASIKNSLIEKMQRGNMYKKTGANKIDEALICIYRAVLTRNKPLLDSAVEQCFEPVSFTNEEGLQYDYTFLQHGPQLQIAAYGVVFIDDEFKIAAFLRDTQWAIPADKKKMIVHYFNQVFLNTLRAGYSDFSTTGRGVSRKGNLFKKLSNKSGLLHNVELVNPKDKELYLQLVERIDNKKPASYGIKPTHQQFWKGDYTIQVRPGYLFTVRSNSIRTKRTETGNGENVLGRTMGDGATDIQRSGDEYYQIFPLWEYDKIPGVTSRDYNKDIPTTTSWGQPGSTQFVGGVSDSLYGANVYQHNFDGVKANKSYFYFDNEIVCLGAGIYSDAEQPITTTINQCWLRTKAFSSKNGLENTDDHLDFNAKKDNWLWQDSIGYFFPEGGNISVTQDFEKNDWQRINKKYKKADTTSGYIFKAWFNHGKKPQNEHYAYIVVPGVDENEMKDYPISDIDILANNDHLQAVYDTKLKILQAVFYEKGELIYGKNKITVNKACVLMLKPSDTNSLSLSVADPTQLLKNVEIGVNGKKVNCQLPTGNYAGSTVELNINKNE
ncbi:polysaccharide lyase family 8 super-sandwich domain-containing protein [Arachidicoccus soli]|nr:polysaccharide lyase family 8 super-sandwich domain-containing protein [Arachidicoccus soli]